MQELLKKGARGKEVEDLQQMLTRLGHSVSADGVFGAETEKAVMTLQKKSGLASDGIVGPDTRKALLDALASVGLKDQAGAAPAKTPAKQ